MEEYLRCLKVVELKRICSNYDINGKNKKAELIEALVALNLEKDEIEECLEDWEMEKQENKKREQQDREDKLRREEQDREDKLRKEEQDREDKLKKEEQDREDRQNELRREERTYQLELARLTENKNNIQNVQAESHNFDMSKFVRPFKEGGDLGLFLVNFERICSQMQFPRDTWSLRLMTVLPPNAAEVIARLAEGEAMSYDSAKSSLLRKYKRNADAYRNKFRSIKKVQDENYGDFAYKLKANFSERIKAENVGNDFSLLVQLICLEKFYNKLPEEVKFWVRDKNSGKTCEKAAELAN